MGDSFGGDSSEGRNSDRQHWFCEAAKTPDKQCIDDALKYQNTLTKPPGSLGELESLAVKFCGYQKTLKPIITKICVRVFAADHGVCAQNVSAFPQIVTTQMIENFVRGGAAISVLSKALDADFAVVNMGIANPLISDDGVIDGVIAAGTKDFTTSAAMTEKECLRALDVGRNVIVPADLFIGGEMGIGNTTAASALYSVLLDIPVQKSVGPGTGLDDEGMSHKEKIIERAIALHADQMDSPLAVLAHLGGFEIAALTGSYIACAQNGIPCLVDGFISTAAALLAEKINPSVKEWFIFSHRSAEPAHQSAIQYFQARPLLDLGMRLGEGSGAAISVPLINNALILHNSMATFDQAGVSEG